MHRIQARSERRLVSASGSLGIGISARVCKQVQLDSRVAVEFIQGLVFRVIKEWSAHCNAALEIAGIEVGASGRLQGTQQA